MIAEIHGKLSQNATNLSERLEDLLTSNVFGAFRYLEPKCLLVPFLNRSEDAKGNSISIPYLPYKVSYSFWPRLPRSEPDVVITLESQSSRKLVILVEAKYMSGKSSGSIDPDDLVEASTPTDQLAREYLDLQDLCSQDDCEIALIYVTAHRILPEQDLLASENEIANFLPGRKLNIYWNSWFHIKPLIENIDRENLSHRDSFVINDLEKYVERKRFTVFQGFLLDQIIEVVPWYSLTPEISEKELGQEYELYTIQQIDMFVRFYSKGCQSE